MSTKFIIPDQHLRNALKSTGVPDAAIRRWDCPCSSNCGAYVLYGVGPVSGRVVGKGMPASPNLVWVVYSVTIETAPNAHSYNVILRGIDSADPVNLLWEMNDPEQRGPVVDQWEIDMRTLGGRGLTKILAREQLKLLPN